MTDVSKDPSAFVQQTKLPWPWRWRHYSTPKCQEPLTQPHSVTSQKTSISLLESLGHSIWYATKWQFLLHGS